MCHGHELQGDTIQKSRYDYRGDKILDDPQPDTTNVHCTKVLVVDDSSVMRLLLTSQLNSWGWEVVGAVDGAEAWELFKEHDFSLVLTDWIMPNMDGLQFLRHVRRHEEWKSTPMFMITTEGSQNKVMEAVNLGATGYVRKPFTAEQIKEKLAGLV